MNPDEIKQMLADAAKSAAEEATKTLLAKQAEEQKQKQAEAQQEAELDSKIKATVEGMVKTVDTGAERLLAEVTKRLEDQNQEAKAALAGLEAALKEKADELNKLQLSKMVFTDNNKGEVEYADIEKAVFLAKMAGKSINATKFGSQLLQKMGSHLTSTAMPGTVTSPASIWETEVSTRMENEVRRKLVVAPLFRMVDMATNVMRIPLNPEAGTATWVQNSEFGNTAGLSAGTAQTHTLAEVTLAAYKLATREYLAYEEEEDSILAIMPVIRDAMVRRTARSLDRAFLYGAGSGADPVQGCARYEATATTTASYTSTANVSTMRTLRKSLGAWGLDPSQLVFIVSTEVYYDLLDDTTFQAMSQVGPQATLLTGQIGMIGNTPVLVSGEFPSKPTSATAGASTAWTNLGAVCVAPGNFLAGSQRGLRFDTQELVETQRRVLVASMRTGMTQITKNLGQGVSTFRWS